MFGALPGFVAHAAALVVCFWSILLCSFAFRLLGQPLIARLMHATVVHRIILKRRLPVLHGLELGRRVDDAPISHTVLTRSGILALDVQDYGAGELLGDPDAASWTHCNGLHRQVVPNPLTQNVRHRQFISDAAGLRQDCITGVVVIAGDTTLSPAIEPLVVRIAQLEGILRDLDSRVAASRSSLDRGWTVLCDLAQHGTPTTLHRLVDWLHPSRLAKLDRVQWAAICAGLVGPIAFRWGLSIIGR